MTFAAALSRAHACTGDVRYHHAAADLANASLGGALTALRTAVAIDSKSAGQHAELLIQLMWLCKHTGHKRYLDALREGGDCLLGMHHVPGVAAAHAQIGCPPDGQAQTVLASAHAASVWSFLHASTGDHRYAEAAKDLLDHLRTAQFRFRFGRLFGGLPLSPNDAASDSRATIAALEACLDYQEANRESSPC
jgi:hypothetical protein